MLSFTLSKDFVGRYNEAEAFKNNPLGLTTFYRTYSRTKDDSSKESWVDVCERVINGMYSIQKDHIQNKTNIPWSDEKAQRSAEEAFDRMFHFKWTPPGRGLTHLGTSFIHERGVVEALQNCSMISSENIHRDGGEFFGWFMEMLMLGIGVGFDTKGKGKLYIRKPSGEIKKVVTIGDSREAWAQSVQILIDSYAELTSHKQEVLFDYSKIRPAGEAISGFGGVASGPAPLIKLHEDIRAILNKYDKRVIDSRFIVDVCNLIGTCVIAGNVRRSAEIALGEPDDTDFGELKNYEKNPERQAYGWVSNNSFLIDTDFNSFDQYAERILDNGEPGFVWMDNARRYGRMNGIVDNKDLNAVGVNPCSEQILHDRELCTLVELYPSNHDSLYDFQRSIKFAYLYGKTITLLNDKIKDEKSRTVMEANRRIGLSMTGIAQFITQRGVGELVKWASRGYDEVQRYDGVYSSFFGVNESIRTTSVKPSGTVSLLAGVTPGIHYPEGRYYIRRIRIADNSPLIDPLRAAGYHIEPDVYSANTLVVSFPVKSEEGIRTVSEVPMLEQMQIAALMQRYWADNSVSCTITFDPKETSKEDIANALNIHAHQLKAVSMLPRIDEGAYEQMVYEEISKEEYEQMLSGTTLPDFSQIKGVVGAKSTADLYCENDVCEIKEFVNTASDKEFRVFVADEVYLD